MNMLLLLIENDIEIYIKYKRLENQDLIKLLYGIEKLYNGISAFNENQEHGLVNYLEIQSINTGESIRIKFKEGWKPHIRSNKNEIEFLIPKQIGVPIIIVYFLFLGIQKSISTYNDYLDTQIKNLELQLKQIELYDKLNKTTKNKTNSVYDFQKEGEKIIDFVNSNDNFNLVKINNCKTK